MRDSDIDISKGPSVLSGSDAHLYCEADAALRSGCTRNNLLGMPTTVLGMSRMVFDMSTAVLGMSTASATDGTENDWAHWVA